MQRLLVEAFVLSYRRFFVIRWGKSFSTKQPVSCETTSPGTQGSTNSAQKFHLTQELFHLTAIILHYLLSLTHHIKHSTGQLHLGNILTLKTTNKAIRQVARHTRHTPNVHIHLHVFHHLQTPCYNTHPFPYFFSFSLEEDQFRAYAQTKYHQTLRLGSKVVYRPGVHPLMAEEEFYSSQRKTVTGYYRGMSWEEQPGSQPRLRCRSYFPDSLFILLPLCQEIPPLLHTGRLRPLQQLPINWFFLLAFAHLS